jgi:hypothetical protein
MREHGLKRRPDVNATEELVPFTEKRTPSYWRRYMASLFHPSGSPWADFGNVLLL